MEFNNLAEYLKIVRTNLEIFIDLAVHAIYCSISGSLFMYAIHSLLSSSKEKEND